jgi:hypothetical protein
MVPAPVQAQPYNPNHPDPDAAYVPPSSPNIAYELAPATAIPAVMVSGISGGQTTEIEAQTTADIYDSQTGQSLLIPQGSKLLGSVDPTSLHQGNYELVQWNQIVLPSGLYLNIQSDSTLLMKSAVDADDQVEGRFVNIPTAAPFATVFFGADADPNSPIAVPAGVLFNAMLTKTVKINPQGAVIPPILTPAALPSVYGPAQSIQPLTTPAAPEPMQVASAAPAPAADPPAPSPAANSAPTDPVVSTNPINITSLLNTGTNHPPKASLPTSAPATADPNAAYVPPANSDPDAAYVPPPAAGSASADSTTVENVASKPIAPPAPPAPPPPPPQPEWYLSANTLVGNDLKSWGETAGWTVVWQASQDWPVPTSTHFQGDFQTVASQVLTDLAAQGANIRGKFYSGNQTLVIFQPGASDAQ